MTALGQTSAQIQSTYMTLLITQLRNQNPLDPMDNNQMASQLAQLSQLEQMENLNSSFSKVLTSQQVNEASSLIGRQIAYIPAGGTSVVWKTVDSVSKGTDGSVTLNCGSTAVKLDDVRQIKN